MTTIWTEPYGDQVHNLGLVSTVFCLSSPCCRGQTENVDLSFVKRKLDTSSSGKDGIYSVLSAEVMGVFKGERGSRRGKSGPSSRDWVY